jgi:predicted anti-sigma-YlaC factor YlaD
MGAVLAAECERARAWVSLGLDGELSQVEQALLRAHVGRCTPCAGFARDLGGLTHRIRSTPLERPHGRPLEWGGMPARRRSTGMHVLRLSAAVAAVVVAAGLGSLAGSLSPRQPAHAASLQFAPKALRVAAVSMFGPQRLPGTRLQKSAPV